MNPAEQLSMVVLRMTGEEFLMKMAPPETKTEPWLNAQPTMRAFELSSRIPPPYARPQLSNRHETIFGDAPSHQMPDPFGE